MRAQKAAKVTWCPCAYGDLVLALSALHSKLPKEGALPEARKAEEATENNSKDGTPGLACRSAELSFRHQALPGEQLHMPKFGVISKHR